MIASISCVAKTSDRSCELNVRNVRANLFPSNFLRIDSDSKGEKNSKMFCLFFLISTNFRILSKELQVNNILHPSTLDSSEEKGKKSLGAKKEDLVLQIKVTLENWHAFIWFCNLVKAPQNSDSQTLIHTFVFLLYMITLLQFSLRQVIKAHLDF